MHQKNGEPKAAKSATDLRKLVGMKVIVVGTIAEIPWQHLVDPPKTHPRINYLNIGREQIVVYTKQEVHCKERIRFRGTVVQIQGRSKRPSSNQPVAEYQIIADDYETSRQLVNLSESEKGCSNQSYLLARMGSNQSLQKNRRSFLC